MNQKFVKSLCFVILLLFDFNYDIFCQNIANNKTVNDDFVYEYDSSDNETKTTTISTTDPKLEPNDDYVYDYGSENSTDRLKILNESKPNITSHVLYDSNSDDISEDTTEGNGDKTSETTENTSETSVESIDNSEENHEKTTEISEKSGSSEVPTETKTTESPESTGEPDLGYEDEESTCDNESLLTKMLRLHEENKNETFVKHVKHINETFERLEHIRNLYKDYFAPGKGFGTELLAFVSSIDIILTPECFASFFALISGLRNNKLWANKFMDTMGRPMESGTADGKHSSFGQYDECLDLESPEDKGLIVKGQYCLVKVVVPYPSVDSYQRGEPYDPMFDEKGLTPFKYFNGGNFTSLIRMIENLNIYNGSAYRLGMCTPHLCKRHEVEEFINKVLYPITRLPLELDDYCIRKDKTEDFTFLQLLSMSIITILVILAIISTGIEIYNIIYERSIAKENLNLANTNLAQEEPYDVDPYYYTFSLVTNTRELFAKNSRFAALDTIRLFTIIHIYIFDLYNTLATIGIVTLKRTYATYPSLVLEYDRYTTLRNTLIFDILFIISGFLLSNAILGKLDRKGGKFNYISYVVNRYFRFAVPLLGSIIFFLSLPMMGSGPIWNEGTKWVTKACENPLAVAYGMLFISNYNDQLGVMERQSAIPYCNPSTWLVSALFQLHITVPIFIILFYKSKTLQKYGLYVAGGAIIVGMLSSIAPTLIGNILPQVQYLKIESYEELFRSFTWYHLSTTQYVISFTIGVFGGYLIRKDLDLPIEYEVMGWVASVGGIAVIYMWSNTFWKPQKSAPLYSVLLWFTFGKAYFAIAITWILFCLCTGRAQTLNYLLSWHNFKPLSRLSFAFFMVHFMLVIRRVFTVKETITMSDGLMMEYSLLDIMYTFCLAYIFYSLIEAPFNNLMAIWLKKDIQSEEEPHMNGNATLQEHSPIEEKRDLRDFGHFNDIALEEDINSNQIETIRI